MAMIEPRFAVLDETDSGLDVDALKVVSNGVNSLRGPEPRRADHHPLHPDPAAHHPGRGARDVRGQDRPDRRPGAGRRTRGDRLRPVRLGRSRPSRRAPSTADAPWPPTSTRGRCARTSRSSHRSGTARRSSTSIPRPPRRSRPPCSTRWTATTSRPTPTCTAGSTSSPRRPPPASRRAVTPSHGWSAAPREGTIFTKNASEAINLVAWSWGVRNLAPGEVDPGHRDGTPQRHRPVADRGRDHRCAGAVRADHRRR